jgi:hypothetical protein
VRIILDECVPRRFGALLTGHAVITLPRAGWAGVKNGRLLTLIDGAYDVFITLDKNLAWQNTASGLGFAVVVLKARSNRIADIAQLAPEVRKALPLLKPGDLINLP